MTFFEKFEKLPAIISWTFLLGPFIFIKFYPEAVAIFFIIFTLFWLLQGLSYSYFLLRSYIVYKKQEAQDWEQIQNNVRTVPHIDTYLYQYTNQAELSQISKKNINDVTHIVIIATYKEPYEILHDTMLALQQSRTNKEKIFIIFALEQRDEENAMKNIAQLKLHFLPTLPNIFYALHPKDTPGEIVGKGSNITFAAKTLIPNLISTYKINQDLAIVTTLDADNIVHPDYFSVLTYTFLRTPQNQRQLFSYQPLPFLYNNYWKVPIFVRLVAISSTFWHLIESSRRDRLRNFSAHAQPLSSLIKIDYWSKITIVEDGHQFWRSYTHFKGNYGVIPLYIPIYQDAVEKEKYWQTLKAQYIQLRRWAHGAEDVGYLSQKLFQKNSTLPFWKTLLYLIRLIQCHVMWATAPVLLMFSTQIFSIFSPSFATSPIFYNFDHILKIYFSVAVIGIVISIWMSFLLLPKPPREETLYKRILLWASIILQWFLLPITTIILSSIPAIEAQTRILFGKKVAFVVTEKRR